MTDYWADLPQLRADGRRVLRWIKQQGVIMCRDPVERVKATEFLLPVFQALEDVIRPMPLVALYLYWQADQPSSLQTTSRTPMQDVDGIEWKDVTGNRGELHAIGLSCEALGRGPEYTRFLFLHELAHILRAYPTEHGSEFHQQLDQLIDRFNATTGSSLVNDRFGLQMRYDSRSYDPLQILGYPPDPCVGGGEFRTEALQ